MTGCRCRKQFGTIAQFSEHLTDDVLPARWFGAMAAEAVTLGLRRQVGQNSAHFKNADTQGSGSDSTASSWRSIRQRES